MVGQDRGEAAILVRYLEKMETSFMMFLKDIENFQWPSPPEHNFVDKHVFNKLKMMNIQPSGLCSDEEYIRRAIESAGGVKKDAAELMGISQRALSYYLAKYRID